MLEVELFGVKLKNPFMAASGTFSYGEEVSSPYGLVVVKGISLRPREGNPQPRLLEVDCGLINTIGLQNVGLEVFLEEKAPFLEEKGIKYAVNILGESPEEYRVLYEKLSSTKAVFLEFNISCPNVKEGGISIGYHEDSLKKLSEQVKDIKEKPIAVKLPPMLDRSKILRVLDILEEFSDMYVVANTYPAISFHWERKVFVRGGLSGPCIRPITLRMVYEISKVTEKPVVGVGGIKDWRSSLEYFFAGAKFVQIGTLNLLDPWRIVSILEGVEDFLRERGFSHIWEVVGFEGVGDRKAGKEPC